MTDDDPTEAPVADDHPFRRRVLVGTASTALGSAWAIAVGLVSLPLLLRGLGAEAFGTWVLLQTFSAVSGWLSLADLGVGVATTRKVAEHAALDEHRKTGDAIADSLLTCVGLGMTFGLLLATIGPRALPALFGTPGALRDDLRIATLLFAAQVVLDLLTEGAEAALEGLQRVDLSRSIDAARRTLVAVATCTAALAGHSLVAVAAASLAASVAGTAGALALLRARRPPGRPSLAGARALLAAGRSVAVLRPLGVLHRTMDRVIVGAVLGPAPVALVEVAAQVQAGAEAVLSASSYAVVPSASWLRARRDESALRELLLVGTRYSCAATFVIVAGGAVLAEPGIDLWLGSGSADAAGLSAVALAYVAVTAPMQVGSNLLLGIGRAGDIFRAAVAAVVVNLAASLVLVHEVGIVGCFVGSLLGAIVLVPLLGRAILHETGTELAILARDGVLRPLLPAAGMAAAAGAVSAAALDDFSTFVLGGGLGLAAAAAAAARFTLAEPERRRLRAVLQSRR